MVATDYEGLGTPGDHPYLIGASQGRAVLDIVRAARQLDPDLSDQVMTAGHSQGGGIGLSIVSRLCALYGWQVGVRPGESKGVVATLRFSPTREASSAHPARA